MLCSAFADVNRLIRMSKSCVGNIVLIPFFFFFNELQLEDRISFDHLNKMRQAFGVSLFFSTLGLTHILHNYSKMSHFSKMIVTLLGNCLVPSEHNLCVAFIYFNKSLTYSFH